MYEESPKSTILIRLSPLFITCIITLFTVTVSEARVSRGSLGDISEITGLQGEQKQIIEDSSLSDTERVSRIEILLERARVTGSAYRFPEEFKRMEQEYNDIKKRAEGGSDSKDQVTRSGVVSDQPDIPASGSTSGETPEPSGHSDSVNVSDNTSDSVNSSESIPVTRSGEVSGGITVQKKKKSSLWSKAAKIAGGVALAGAAVAGGVAAAKHITSRSGKKEAKKTEGGASKSAGTSVTRTSQPVEPVSSATVNQSASCGRSVVPITSVKQGEEVIQADHTDFMGRIEKFTAKVAGTHTD